MADLDEREEELSSIAAIFPELAIDADKGFAASIDIPVAPSASLAVGFSLAVPPPSPSPASESNGDGDGDDGKAEHYAAQAAHRDERRLDHLPPLHLEIVLPQGYPEEKPPQVTISTNPEWLPAAKLRQLEQEVDTLWDEYGKCQILFSYIDHLQQSAERAFDLGDGLTVSSTLKSTLVDYDTRSKNDIFDSQNFDCGICITRKKGSECYRSKRCNHVFCRSCLQEAYTHFITEGDIVHVRCLDPKCGEGNEAAPAARKNVQRTLHPRELLDMSIPEPTVRRYVEMKRKKRLESDKTTTYCPRSWCQAPARSAKYPPLPANLRDCPESESDEDLDSATPADSKTPSSVDRLCICSKCALAFCKVCHNTWHGEFARCLPKDPGELSEEEKASYDYILLNTTPCPTCSAPVQKSYGCNHMTCFQCQNHFCYLCSAWLDGSNPYPHFNRKGTPCFQQLFDPEDAAGQPGGNQFWEQEARRVVEEADRADAERLQNEENQRPVVMDAEDEIGLNRPAVANRQVADQGQHEVPPEAPEPPQLLHPIGAMDFWELMDNDPAVAEQFRRLQVQFPGDEAMLRMENLLMEIAQERAQGVPHRARDHFGQPYEPREPGRPRRGQQVDNAGRGRGQGPNPRNAHHHHHGNNAQRNGPGGGGARAAPRGRGNARPPQARDVHAGPFGDEDAAGLRRFIDLAIRDQEEDWDSDELGDGDEDGAWEIRPRVRQ